MKKIFVVLAIAVVSISLPAQTKSGFTPFHTYFEKQHGDLQKLGNQREVIYKEIGYSHDTYVTSAGTWTPADSGVFYYSQNTNQVWQIAGTFLNFVQPNWDTTGQVIDAVDANGFVQSITGQVRNGSSWVNSYSIAFTYYAVAPVGYLSTEIIKNAAGSDSIGYDYTFDSIGRLTKLVVQTGASLQNDSQYIYTYTGWNATQQVTQAWSGSTWVNVANRYNNFDANGNNIQSTGYTWSGSVWVVNNQTISSYSANNHLQTYYYQLWDASANGGLGGFVNNYYENYQYVLDENTQFQNYNWNSVLGTWTPDLSITYNYDSRHNLVYEQDQQFASDTFGNTDLYFYYYSPYDVSAIYEVKNELNAGIFPNPISDGLTNVSLTTVTAGNVALNIYDLTGKLLKHQLTNVGIGVNQLQLNLPGLAAGNYYLQITDNSGMASVLKFMKQ